MNDLKLNLTYENRLILNENAGTLVHSFSDGYCIINEIGEEINTFADPEEFNRLIEKFRYRNFLIEKLDKQDEKRYYFGEDNVLMINSEISCNQFWNLPKSEIEVEIYFQAIRDLNLEIR